MENNPQPKKSTLSKPWMQSAIGIFVVVLVLVGFLYWKSTSSYISIDMSQISAPVIAIGPEAEGILSEVYVKAGDSVRAGQSVARVGSEILSTKISGIVTDVQNTPGQVFTVGSPVVSMIDPQELRVVGTIDENKGLSRIHIGDPASFTVDAFGGTVFTGVVDEISSTSKNAGIMFSISDKREIKRFEIKVRYDILAHPEFKSGMSAKLKIYAN